jgi:hypothetical protein
MPVYHLLLKIFFPVFHSRKWGGIAFKMSLHASDFVLLRQMVLKHVNHVNHGGNMYAIRSVKFHQEL